MKICYLGNFQNKFSDTTEKHISSAFRSLGHEVIEYNEADFNIDKILALQPDLFFFHKGGEMVGIQLPQLVELLNKLTCKKVCWYFDKFFQGREQWAEIVIPFCDYVFVTDGSYMRRKNFKNVYYLNQGIGAENAVLGTPQEHLTSDIAFTGSLYGDRHAWAKSLTEVYGNRFKIFNYSFGKNLCDLCASTKIFVAPRYPSDDHYWSSRIYMIIGSGGFLIHPRLEGLKTEFKENEHLVMYKDGRELREKIDYYLEHEEERKKIQMAGFEFVKAHYTYVDRVKELLNICTK
jgi:hypothetical protein